jgi:hypothetical protein
MNKIFLICIAAITLVSCKERMSSIDYKVPPKGRLNLDSQYIVAGVPSSFPKMVFIVDFSGIKCANCPAAASLIEGLSAANPGRIAELVMYSSLDGSLSDSFTDSKSSYKTLDADNMRNALGGPNVLPELAVDQKQFSGESRIVIANRTNLPTYYNSEAALSSPASVTFLSKSIDPASNTLKMTIQVQYGASVNDSDYLSVAIKENNLVDAQDSNGTEVKAYNHNGVLRKYIYPQNGILFEKPSAGKTYIVSFNTVLQRGWNADNLKVIAMLHKQKPSFNNYYVSQVNETSVK